MRFLAIGLLLMALASGCSVFGSDPTPTPTIEGVTPTPTPLAVADLPDGPLLELSPGTGSTITSQAALVRGTVASGSTVRINGVDTEVDPSGDFVVAVIVGPGENVITVEVTGSDGTPVRRNLRVIGS